MNIAVLGTGVVGETITTALTEKGHNVRMGSRSANNEKAAEWVKKSNNATHGNFNDAASFGEIVFLCLNGAHALDAVNSVDANNVAGKMVIDGRILSISVKVCRRDCWMDSTIQILLEKRFKKHGVVLTW